MAQDDGHVGVVRLSLDNMPFYESMKIVKDGTRLHDDELLDNQVGFKAQPEKCICGHEWNAFDVIIEAVRQKGHDWDFFKDALLGESGGFFFRKTALTCCRCGIQSSDVGVLYKYKVSKTLGWGY